MEPIPKPILFPQRKRGIFGNPSIESTYRRKRATNRNPENGLKAQVDLLTQQMHTKDGQIEKLNENMQRQAVHIQSLIQENSRLNIKLLPENTEIKKPWWKFW